jgi:hypothetical protein
MANEIEPTGEFDSVRKVFVEDEASWYYVVVDVVERLTQTPNPSRYWTDIKRRVQRQADRLGREELYDFIVKFPFKHSTNNRTYQFDCANQTGILRIVQDIQSENELVERLKLWMAETASRRIDQLRLSPIERERERYRQLGRSEEWIHDRLASVATRNELTDEWQKRGVQGREYGILTNTVHEGTFELSVRKHKELKSLEKGDLRDQMTPRELAFTILGEDMTTTEIRKTDAQNFPENLEAAVKGGEGAGKLRRQFEEITGESVVSSASFLNDGAHSELAAGDEDEDSDK